jgi:hypothetical protein
MGRKHGSYGGTRLADLLVRCVQAREIKAHDLARMSGVPACVISRALRGNTRRLSPVYAGLLADSLGIDRDLLDGTVVPPAQPPPRLTLEEALVRAFREGTDGKGNHVGGLPELKAVREILGDGAPIVPDDALVRACKIWLGAAASLRAANRRTTAASLLQTLALGAPDVGNGGA